MKTYQEVFDGFSWDEVLKMYGWNPNEKFNMAFESCDRWAENQNRIAIYWEDETGLKETWTYQKLKEQSNQMANLLESLGVKKGDRIAGLLGKDMELILTVLAVWKIGAIYVPLFTAFGPEALAHRLNDSECKLLVTNKEQAKKVTGRNISVQTLLIDDTFQDSMTFKEFADTFSVEYEIEQTTLMDPCTIQYTSGSTGLAKGALWAHKILISIYPYQRYAIGTELGDRFFGGADLGWAYGLIQSTFAPLSFGVPILIYKGKFQPKKFYQLMQDYKITSFAHAPTAYRAMMSAGSELVKQYKFSVKKFSSAGEPLNDEVVRFFKKNFGREIYDHYGATETGMIVNNYNATDMSVKPGSMGFPSPGYHVALVNSQGKPVEQGETGEIAVDITKFPCFFLGYWNKPEKTKEKIRGKWLLTGDLAKQDKDHYFWFQGRSDDIISSAGYRIGPFEVESSLLEHPAVSEAAVIGKPDATKGEIVKAFVVLNVPYKPSDELAHELSIFVKEKLSYHQYPREVEFMEQLPKTQSGKIQRFRLRENMEMVKE